MIEGHGDDLFRYGGRIKINFSSNIPQNADHSGLLEYLNSVGDIFRNYPEPSPLSIERKLAKTEGVDPENIIVTNGATEAIYLLAHLYEGKRSSIYVPTFREYQDACRIFSHKIDFITSTKEISRDADLVWLCNPDNPTGLTFHLEHLLSLSESLPETLFIIDQAYGLYSVKPVVSVGDALEKRNIILLQSFTKQFSVPGLRLGYAVGDKNIIGKLKNLRMPWSVNSYALAAAHYLLSHKSDYTCDYVALHNEAERMISELRKTGYPAGDTDCNFFLAGTPVADAARLKEWLVDNYGILIRDASNFEGLSPRHFRIAAQTPEENNLLIKALKEWIALF